MVALPIKVTQIVVTPEYSSMPLIKHGNRNGKRARREQKKFEQKQRRRDNRKQRLNTENESQENAETLGKNGRLKSSDLLTIHPKNPRQQAFVRAFNTGTPIIFQDGFAGTGKTLLACYYAMREVLDQTTDVDRVIIIRSAVATRDVGFLKGDLDEKQEPFEATYHDNFKKILKYKEGYTHAKSTGQVEFRLSSHLRGLTFDNAIIIVDEVQCMDYEEIMTILGRAGRNTRIIMCGDNMQNDLKRKRNEKSGYEPLVKLLDFFLPRSRSERIVYRVEDCLRSDLVRDILEGDLRMREQHPELF